MPRLSSGLGTDRTLAPREHCLVAAPCPPNPAAAHGQAGPSPPSMGSSVTHVGANRSLQPLQARFPGQPLPGETRALTKLHSRDVGGHLPSLGVHTRARATSQVPPWLPRASQGCSPSSLPQTALPAHSCPPKPQLSPLGPGNPGLRQSQVFPGNPLEIFGKEVSLKRLR